MSPAEHALQILEARAELIRNAKRAIVEGRTELVTTVGTDANPSVTESK